MPTPAAELLPVLAPELAETAPGVLDVHLELAAVALSEAVFKDRYQHALALLVAHWLTLRERGGAGGSITSEKEGQVSRNYSSPPSRPGLLNDLDSTSYGQTLQGIMRVMAFAPRTRMTGVVTCLPQ